ncbi:MAG: alpha/beta hydrolase [Anaerolineae bacterium]|jgi:predicted esterase|nr:alpha/beta hydrolase [Anaerolineae bacterium]
MIHENTPVYQTGTKLQDAKSAMILIHGRGATAQSILELGNEWQTDRMALIAPQAAGGTWYPNRFIAPIESNEPALSSGLAKIATLLTEIHAAGIAPDQVILLGFSQGACLALEYAARNPQRYGGVIGLSGGLIGELGTPLRYAADADLQGTPVFLGCSDVDFHIPKERVEESAQVLQAMQAQVTMRLYPGMGHTVNQDEIAFVQTIIDQLGK